MRLSSNKWDNQTLTSAVYFHNLLRVFLISIFILFYDTFSNVDYTSSKYYMIVNSEQEMIRQEAAMA
jgi:hypothetical protein